MIKSERRSTRVIGIAAVVIVGLASIATAAVAGFAPGASSSSTSTQGDAPPITLPPEIAKAWDEAKASGRMAIVDKDGKTRGYVPFDSVAGLGSFGDYPKGVIPISDDNGQVTGYAGPYVGFIDRAIVEQADFDLAAYVAKEMPDISQAQLDNLYARGPAAASP